VFRKVLYYTYNPFLKYHIRKIPDEVVGTGMKDLNLDTWGLLNKLALRKLSGIAARETLFEYLETLTPAAALLLKLIIQKDLKAGIAVKSINNTLPDLIPTFECQLVDDWEENRITYPILIGPKIDGTRGEKRGQHVFTRRGHQIIGLQHIVNYIATVNPNQCTSGELFIPGMPFRRSNGIIKSNKPKKPNVRYAIFDILYAGNLTMEERADMISKMYYPLGTKPLPPVCHIPQVVAQDRSEVDKMYNLWRSRGYEGLVGKDPRSLPAVGKNHAWWRLVSCISVELRIIGIYESEEKPGYMGGIVVEGGIRIGSGFYDSERLEYLRNPGLIIGKTATIEAKERTAAGSLRQPVFKAVRWDL
jgi:ATP-dependent DNA ligase